MRKFFTKTTIFFSLVVFFWIVDQPWLVITILFIWAMSIGLSE